MLPPYAVLHVELLGYDSSKLRDALASKDKPQVVIIPSEGLTSADAQKLLRDSGLWFIEDK